MYARPGLTLTLRLLRRDAVPGRQEGLDVGVAHDLRQGVEDVQRRPDDVDGLAPRESQAELDVVAAGGAGLVGEDDHQVGAFHVVHANGGVLGAYLGPRRQLLCTQG